MPDQQVTPTPAEEFERVRRGILRIARESVALEAGFPGEVELARRLGCGRGQVRRVMGSLEHEGIVIRKQGVPTRVDRPALALTSRLDERLEVSETLLRWGFSPSAEVLGVELGSSVALAPGHEPDEAVPASIATVLHRADGEPAIVERIELALRERGVVPAPGPLDDCIEALWGEPALWEVATVAMSPVQGAVAEALGLPAGTVVPVLDGAHVLRSGRRVARTRRWHRPERFQYAVLRTPAFP